MMKNLYLALLCLLITLPGTGLAQEKNDDYIILDSILVKTPDGAQISAIMARKKGVDKPMPTILMFTIYARQTDINKVKEAADRGYVGVMAYSRGKRYSPDTVVPYEKENQDVNAVIDWISKQAWSDGRVGMYGGSYNGFAQWSATKKLHPALKTIVPSASVAPGIDAPMHNNVVMSFPFSWTYYVSNNKFLDNEDYNGKHWNELDRKWFNTGSSYRTRDSLLGRPANRIFRKWLDHPTYDAYWQSMTPYKDDFARINIPILSTTGYYDGGQVGELYYLREHVKYNPKAEHYLIIGPYGHFGAQGKPDSVLNGYKIDHVARIPIHDIIYQWFDYIFKAAPKPAILKDKINYQVMGSNAWKHTPTLDAMATGQLTMYLDDKALNTNIPSGKDFTRQTIDFKKRDRFHSYYYVNQILYDTLYTNGIRFVSKPFERDTEFSGRFTGQMQVEINKKDMDYSVVLFEQMPDGRMFYLTYYMGRASYTHGIEQRQLIQPGMKTALPFENTYVTSRKLSKGSRLVAVLNVNKSAFEQINYGTGGDVNDETINDAGKPLKIKWYNDSFIRIPVAYK